MNPHRNPLGVTSAAGTARGLPVNPIAEGSAGRAPCARSPAHPTRARTRHRLRAGWEPDSEARASGRTVWIRIFFFLNNHKVFEIEREILSETNKTKRRETWRDQRQIRVRLKPSGQGERKAKVLRSPRAGRSGGRLALRQDLGKTPLRLSLVFMRPEPPIWRRTDCS